ncbi:MAG: hypothetical protein AB1758_17240 [Candidatus Eremiobacterota bacterium]
MESRIERATPPGLEIELDTSLPKELPEATIWFSEAVKGSVRHEQCHPALAGLKFGPLPGSVQVHLEAHDSDLRLTDFGFTGFIKPTIDQLWPVLGGAPGKPEDHRIRRLVVSRSSADRDRTK